MTEAPERIWLPQHWWRDFVEPVYPSEAQYIRADLVDAQAIREAALREAADELKRWGYNTAVRAILALIEKEKTK